MLAYATEYAIHYNQTEAALLLIELGADLNKPDRCAASLHYCAIKALLRLFQGSFKAVLRLF
jgi:hypothetical protein